MAEFHLMRPALLLLWLLLPLVGWALLRQQSQAALWHKVLPAHLQPAMLDDRMETGQKVQPMWLLLALFIAIFALAGPAWDKEEVPLFQLQKGRVLVLDMSDSMWATDLPPNRLTQARFKATDLLRQAGEGEMALVAYAGDAFILAPMTEDRATLLNLLPALSPEIMPVRGSNLPAALQQADRLLRDAGYQQGDIVLLTDDLPAEHMDAALELAETQPWRLQILALGSEDGAPMKRPSGELVRDLDGSVAIVRTHFERLQKLANASGGELVRYRPDSADINALLHDAPELGEESEKASEQHHSQWRDRGGQILLLALLPLAFGMRRQGLLSLLLLLMPLSITPQQAEAAWWQNADQAAKAQFDAGQFGEAAEGFTDPAWKGAAYYRAGDYAQALAAFEQVEGVDALYNQGNALAQLAQYPQAAERYRSVLAQQPDHQAARDNLEWVEQQMQQSPEQQQNDSDQGDKGEGENPSGGESDQTEPGEGQQDDNGQPSDSEPSEQPGEQQPDDSGSASPSEPEPQQGEQEPPSEQPGQAEPQPESGDPSEREPESQGEAQAAEAREGDPNDEQLQRLLDQVVDDPARLLRNKMELEYERRRQSGDTNREQTQW
ncbi:VWA domain-containing protein [Ferrimonas balearica]|uniref:vWA domain-containing protein n=1 Tax=Ferrimonas balearica TaxID=44012 RepID=UPI001C93995F|nr:VWA domain-containing protein [Ferrimonas balearica]MBY6106716.1 VWA domain-containing protein [Ferrimonas balearica]